MALHDPVLVLHITAGTAGLALGPVAMLAPKRRGRHTRAGGVYHWTVLAVCLSATGLALLSWPELWWFLPIAAFSYANALLGYMAVRIRWANWLGAHIAGMGGSYIALVTALLVVNGSGQLILWFLPTIVGTPLIAWAINRVTAASAMATVTSARHHPAPDPARAPRILPERRRPPRTPRGSSGSAGGNPAPRAPSRSTRRAW
jgi:hypothetical protein